MCKGLQLDGKPKMGVVSICSPLPTEVCVKSLVRFSPLVIVLLAFAALAQGTYTQIDVPGATLTGCSGIDTAGQIAGAYMDSAGKVNGFFLSGDTYTTINYRGQGTTLGQLNDAGQIVGVSAVGFVYDLQSQTFTNIHDPNGYTATPTSINNAGTVVGYY